MEYPKCNYCGSDTNQHTKIYYNVKNTKHDLVECQNCQLRFYSPRTAFSDYLANGFGKDKAAQKEAEQMYNYASFTHVNDPDWQKKILKSYYDKIVISKLLKLKPDFSKCYEIGSSVGWLSHFVNEIRPDATYNGCELNHYSVQIANEKFGLNLTAGTFDTVNPPENEYDVVFAMDYIEHTFTPYDDLKKMYKIMKKDSIIFMKTFLEELDVNRTMEAPIGHSHHFFGHVLRKMIEDCGFKILEWTLENEQVIIVGQK